MIGELIGITAAVLIGSGFIPQIHKGYKTKKMGDLSYPMFFLLMGGTLLWFVYGLYLWDLILIFANLFNACCSILIISMKYHYSKKLKS